MKSFILLTFALLGAAWFHLSGGSEYQAGTRGLPLPNLLASSYLPPAPQAAAPQKAPQAEMVQLATARAGEPAVQVTKAAAAPADLGVTLAAAPRSAPIIRADPAVAVEEAPEPVADLRQVTGSRVNMRSGPSTRYAVMAQLGRGHEVQVVADPGDGWVKLRSEGGRIGWMSEDFLRAVN